MTWVLAALILLLAGAVVASAVLWGLLVAARAETGAALAQVDVLKAKLADAAQQLAKIRVTEDDAQSRLEAVIAGLKAEISNLEADLHACSTPDAVADRLDRLLDPPEVPVPGAYGTDPRGGGVPPGSAPTP